MARKQKFRNEIYVVREEADGEPYLTAFDNTDGAVEQAGDEGEVAVYKLDEVCAAQITRTLRQR
jgi:hypothetical protein